MFMLTTVRSSRPTKDVTFEQKNGAITNSTGGTIYETADGKLTTEAYRFHLYCRSTEAGRCNQPDRQIPFSLEQRKTVRTCCGNQRGTQHYQPV